MTSLIDATKPVYGNPSTQSVRDNFLHAYDEITDLQSKTDQAPFLPIAGGTMDGAIVMQADPLNPMEVATKHYVDDIVFGQSGTVPDAPTDGLFYARGNTLGGNTWSHDPLFSSVHIGPNSTADRFRIGSDATYNFIKFSPGNDFLRYNPTTNIFGIVRNNIVVQSWTATDATLTIPLTLPGNPTAALHAAPKQYIDAQIAGAAYVNRAGDTMTGALTLINQLRVNAVADARININSTGAPVNAKIVDMYADSVGNFSMQFVNDAFNAGTNFFTVTRNGYATTGLTLTAPAISLIGQVSSSGNITAGNDIIANGGVYPAGSTLNKGFMLWGDPTYRYIRFTTDNWRLLFNASTGNLSFDRPDGQNQIVLYNDGGLWTRSTITGNADINAVGNLSANGVVYASYSTMGGGFALYADTVDCNIRFTTDNWRIVFQRSTGALLYWHPGGYSLFSIDASGSGWFRGNLSANVDVYAQSLHASSRLFANDIMNTSGTFYVANNYAYYLQRSSDSNWYFVENGTINFTVSANGDNNARGTSYATHQLARGNVYALNDWTMYFGGGGGGRVLQFASGWYWDWVGTSGLLQWVTPSGPSFVLDPNRHVQFHGGNVYINGARLGLQTNCIGIAYSSGAYNSNNTFLFGWSNIVGSLVTASIDNGGAAYALANASDERLKLDIQPSTFDALDTVNRIPLFEYDWLEMDDPWKLKEARVKSTKSPLNLRSRIGIIAQRLREVFPEGVTEGDDFDDHLGRVWGLDQNVMIALLLGSIQQLTTRIEQLETRQ